MKKSFSIILIFILCISFIMSGCGKSFSAQNSASGSTASAANISQSDSNAKKDVVVGRVDSILGNEVELSVADISENMKQRLLGMENGSSSKSSNQNNQSSSQNSGPNSQQGTRLETGLQQGGQGGFGGSGGPGGGNFQNPNSMNRQRSQFKFTGEKKTIDIPVGVPIITTKRGTNGIEQTKVDLSSILEGSILYIIYENDNIVQVRLMNASQQSQQSQQ